jgi:hypothetical protein
VRDEQIGWSSDDKEKGLVHLLDAYLVGAVPDYTASCEVSLGRRRQVRNNHRFGDGPSWKMRVRKALSLLGLSPIAESAKDAAGQSPS